MFMGAYWERKNRFKYINRFSNIEAKVIFSTVLRSKSNVFFFFLQFPLGIVEKHAKKKQAYYFFLKFNFFFEIYNTKS